MRTAASSNGAALQVTTRHPAGEIKMFVTQRINKRKKSLKFILLVFQTTQLLDIIIYHKIFLHWICHSIPRVGSWIREHAAIMHVFIAD